MESLKKFKNFQSIDFNEAAKELFKMNYDHLINVTITGEYLYLFLKDLYGK